MHHDIQDAPRDASAITLLPDFPVGSLIISKYLLTLYPLEQL
jgi:hypothetical protein